MTKPKKILVDAVKLTYGHGDGSHRYVLELLLGLMARAPDYQDSWHIDFLLNNQLFPISEAHRLYRFPNWRQKMVRRAVHVTVLSRARLADLAQKLLPESVVSRLKKTDHSIGLTPTLRDLHQGAAGQLDAYDLIHVTMPQTYRIFEHADSKWVFTVHDVTHKLFPDYHLDENVQTCEAGMRFALGKNAFFITVSEASRSDLIAHYPVDADRVLAAPLACDPGRFGLVTDESRLRKVRRKYGIPEGPYLLALSTLEPRKNVRAVVQAYGKLLKECPDIDLCLVLAGKKGWKSEDLFEDRALDDKRIVVTGFVDEQDLAPLYSGSLALAFVSLYEGFGLPALEAMSCGVPVIYGNRSSLPEVVGDAGLAADPTCVEDIKRQMKRLVTDRALREQLARRARHRAAQFSWAKTVEVTLQAYQRALA